MKRTTKSREIAQSINSFAPLRALSWLVLFLALTAGAPVLAQSGFVTTRGKQFVGPGGRPIFLKGTNLGNWLLPEGYMFKFKTASSPRLIERVVNQLVGPDEARKFWHAYRDRYITLEDIRFIKRAGFNSGRVRFNCRLVVTEGDDPPGVEGGGDELLDRVVGWCRRE